MSNAVWKLTILVTMVGCAAPIHSEGAGDKSTGDVCDEIFSDEECAVSTECGLCLNNGDGLRCVAADRSDLCSGTWLPPEASLTEPAVDSLSCGTIVTDEECLVTPSCGLCAGNGTGPRCIGVDHAEFCLGTWVTPPE